MSATSCTDFGVPFVDMTQMHAEVLPELSGVWEDVVASGRFVGGPRVEQFEHEWARTCGRRCAVGTANGTDALELTLRAFGIGPGDEVIVPANTFIATAAAVVAAGATPRFVDVDEATLVLTADALAAAVGPRTAAVIAVHLYGQVCDMAAITTVARMHGIAVIEDAAQAHLATRDGRPAGSFGDAACFSFYPGKNLGALGDGGAVVTDHDDVASRVRSLADHGRTAASRQVHERIGRNSRLDALQAAFLSVKLRRLPAWTDARRRIANQYDHALSGTAVRPLTRTSGEPAFHLYVVRVADRDACKGWLASRGIETGIHYAVPCHLQPAFAGAAEQLPVVERAARTVLSLPMHPHLAAEEIAVVTEAIAKWDRAA